MKMMAVAGLGVLAMGGGVAAAQDWLAWPPQPAPARSQSAVPQVGAPVRIGWQTGAAGEQVLWLENDLHGPVEVRIDSARPLPGLPLQRTVTQRGRQVLHRVAVGGVLDVRLRAVPGVPGVSAQPVRYRLPLHLPQIRLGQLPGGSFSHHDAENRHALDFTAPIGTPVLAARAGVVMQAEGRFGDRPGRLEEANFIRILHGDGSMAVYAHLRRGSLKVRPGQQVAAGTVIAESGNSGYSSGPHLHFVVQVNQGMQLVSVPVRIDTDQGELRLPQSGG